jgi:trans-aconitate 2-methyltransferase
VTEWNAADYNRQSSLQQMLAGKQLALLTLSGSERVLDVGCGDGKITAEIASRLPNGSILGVDPSRDMISFATAHFGPPVHENLRFEVADATQLPYRNQFDLAVSFNALHWVPDQAAALRSIRAALKIGGRAILKFVPQGPRTSLEDVIEQVRNTARWKEYFSGFQKPFVHFTPEEYRELAAEAGLRVVRIELEDVAWDFKTREGFLNFCRATFVEWTRLLPKDQSDEFIINVLDGYQTVAAGGPSELNTFKFYQLTVELTAAGTNFDLK